MPEKLSPYATYGEKIIKLFAKLLFSGQSYSLTDLSRMLGCSKQTVLRLMDDIRRSYGVEIEETVQERNKYYRLKRPGRVPPALALTGGEMSVLLMCQAFARHLLGDSLFEEAATALEKNRALASAPRPDGHRHFTSFRPGSIDYTPHEGAIRTLLEAMESGRICTVDYRSLLSSRSKRFLVMPLKIFSHNDTVYLSARYAGKPGQAPSGRDYDPLLAVHRLRRVEMTDQTFEYPKDFDFEKIYNRNFGIIKGDAFDVEVEFTGLSARYVAERMWSPDQRISRPDPTTVRLSFSTSSERELLSWVLSFGDEARIVRPERMVVRFMETLRRMQELYPDPIDG
ncbi:MAG TPA: WYL domain-containing protein [Deltaproteobacteria bacterium]|nr:WYL domain-containing protein [Deltaproteobacteria bacterium]